MTREEWIDRRAAELESIHGFTREQARAEAEREAVVATSGPQPMLRLVSDAATGTGHDEGGRSFRRG